MRAIGFKNGVGIKLKNKCEYIFQMCGLWLDVDMDMAINRHRMHDESSLSTTGEEKNPKSYMMEYLHV